MPHENSRENTVFTHKCNENVLIQLYMAYISNIRLTNGAGCYSKGREVLWCVW